MKKVKILAIDQGEHLGGAERFFAELLTRLPATYEVHLITDGNAEYHKLYKHSSVIFHHVHMPALKPLNFKTLKSWLGLQRTFEALIDEVRPDVIISNTVRTHLLVSRPARRKNIPLVWMMHDATFPMGIFRWLKKYPRSKIACSKYIADLYDADQVLYPYGVDEEVLKKYQSVRKAKVIGMVGKFIPWKGQDLFIQAARDIHRHHPDYRFVIVGQSYQGNRESETYQKKCLELIERLKMQSLIEIKTEVQDVLSEMATWEILVHCSTTPEPLGRVILEGMSAGCAVIASDQGGPLEILQEGRLGLPIHPGVEQLTTAVSRLIENLDLREKLTGSASAWVLENCTWKKVMKTFERMVGDPGLEPGTSTLSVSRSNHLS